ncbi:hypothetical protein [Streptomyces sp. NPDC101455]|uniref:hypothetical protein n=1 Tax=Streptomyces sp. NPDC101455 TaxID=3366142 RepID=UPI003820DD91
MDGDQRPADQQQAVAAAKGDHRDLVSALPPELNQAFQSATFLIARHWGIAG